MNLKILLPTGIFAGKAGVSRIVSETRDGSFGLLPHRLDRVAALEPRILTYETEADGKLFDAVPRDRMREAEQAVHEAVAKIPEEISARFESADKLSDDDRATILEIDRASLGDHEPASLAN